MELKVFRDVLSEIAELLETANVNYATKAIRSALFSSDKSVEQLLLSNELWVVLAPSQIKLSSKGVTSEKHLKSCLSN